MIKSMTGFGKQAIIWEGNTIVIEIRTLNSKQLDLSIRVASLFREKENEIRSLISKELERGKIEANIYIEKSESQNITINGDLIKEYYHTLSRIAEEMGIPVTPELFVQTTRMPEVIAPKKDELSNTLWEQLYQAIESTCAKVNEFRTSEGAHLATDFEKRVNFINLMIHKITPYEKERTEAVKNKLQKQLADLSIEGKYDKNRLEEELIYYIEKFDITEEKVRLQKHCSYFLETMKEKEANGKKLAFIVQEFGREINTIGSKANDFNIQQIVVQMKDEVEKMKEQLANIL